MRRICVIGTSGCGKTTLARQLAEKLGYAHVELDALHWGPGWQAIPKEDFREKVDSALSGETWVVDGNYSPVRDIIWERADTIVWLNYSFPLIFGRVTRRTIKRVMSGEELWNGNRERFLMQLVPKESILWWVVKTYRRRKREYPLLFAQPEYSHLDIHTFSHPKETDNWFRSLR